ncbi:anthranilate synthase/aminodeoxychorismate synthase-like glutamine amidotransferase [Alkalibacillus flavidus]|uniref:Anthranilate synthase/aminodeoxychorismate synthase-like glutamine amidotransferase n=1 Tax=Alkalibacillus flavidus TaxID=546021 RepID=A0ABV2KVJ1_9BACI
MIVMIDHDDSFTYNIVDYMAQTGARVKVLPYDQATFENVLALQPKMVVLSPGPGNPNDAPKSVALLQKLAGRIPVLGICLGFQIVVHAFGGRIGRARMPMHGKREWINHDGDGMFSGIDSPTQVTRYHSLIAETEDIPCDLKVTSWTDEGDVMGVRHKQHAIEAVQFHPEAILTTHGKQMIRNAIRDMARGGARVE